MINFCIEANKFQKDRKLEMNYKINEDNLMNLSGYDLPSSSENYSKEINKKNLFKNRYF